MPSIKQHYSTVTQKWSPCGAGQRKCRYAKHKNVKVDDKKNLWSDFVKGNLPKTVELVSTNGTKHVMTVQTPGSSGKRCTKCKTYLSQELADEVAEAVNLNLYCPECGAEIDMLDSRPPVLTDVTREEAHLLLDDDAVRETRWFHGTFSDDWAEEVEKAGIYIHAGSFRAAEDRLWYFSGTMQSGPAYIYELRIKPETAINSNIAFDDNQFPENPKTRNKAKITPDTVTRYVNTWENSGSVSLISTVTNFEVVNKQIVNL
jgi:hypothetical protein